MIAVLYTNSGVGNYVVNNTIYSNHLYGIWGWKNNAATLYVYNNIILSNRGYGINITGPGAINVGNNCLYGNVSGPWSAGTTILAGNITNFPPMIDATVSSLQLVSPKSPCYR